MQYKNKLFNAIYLLAGAVAFVSCQASGDDPGLEYSPQMYHSVAYEPLTQITEDGVPDGIISSWYYGQKVNSLPYNDYSGEKAINSIRPVKGTVPRQNFVSVTGTNEPQKDQDLFFYDLHKDSIDLAARILKNPVPDTEEVLAQGKHLYIGFCAPCHGEKGDGQGKVGVIYKGVPNYAAGRYATLNEGHLFHTITHGKGRMWAHKSQLNPEERWMVVRYVQKLQKGS